MEVFIQQTLLYFQNGEWFNSRPGEAVMRSLLPAHANEGRAVIRAKVEIYIYLFLRERTLRE